MSYEIKSYPDGSTYPIVDLGKPEFTFRINSNGNIIELLQIIDSYNHNGIVPKVTIPCLYYSQDDDRWKENSSFNLKLVCGLLNTVSADYVIFHPHNSGMIKALLKSVTVMDNSELLLTLKEDHAEFLDEENLVILSPDAGAYKWVNKMMEKVSWESEIQSASKVRDLAIKDGRKMKQQLPIQDFGGKDILIVDDLCVFGGTFKGLSELLNKANVGKKYLAVSHMTVQNLGIDPVTNYFDKVYTSNSKYDTYSISVFNSHWDHPAPDNLEIIKMF